MHICFCVGVSKVAVMVGCSGVTGRKEEGEGSVWSKAETGPLLKGLDFTQKSF